MDDAYVKILFNYYSNVLDEYVVEMIWATTIDAQKGHYKIDNIPFYGAPVASDDIVLAEYNKDEERIVYVNTIEYSGNSVVLVTIMTEIKIEYLRNKFKELGCTSEKVNEKYFAMDIPKSVDYKIVKAILEKYEKEGLIGYAEPILSSQHR